MGLTTEVKKQVVTDFGRGGTDTGSAEVQVALLTSRILELTEHMKIHKKDFSTRRGLLRLVGRRSSLLKYLARTDHAKYVELIGRLGLRK